MKRDMRHNHIYSYGRIEYLVLDVQGSTMVHKIFGDVCVAFVRCIVKCRPSTLLFGREGNEMK